MLKVVSPSSGLGDDSEIGDGLKLWWGSSARRWELDMVIEQVG